MFMGLWILVLLVAVITAAGWSSNGHGSSPPTTSAHDILDQRLARGELTPTEHAERRATLGTDTSRTGRRWGPWTILGLGAAVALLVATLAPGWGWTGMGWTGGHMGWGGTTATNAAPYANAREVTVEAGDLWFAPDRIEVVAGEQINLRVANTGATFHDLTIPAADVMLDVEAGGEVVGGLRLDAPGTYEFYCSVPGHSDAGMAGTIVVTA